jgi:hypothetical protein
MSQRHHRLTARHWRRRLYRWRRAAGLSVIAIVAWLVRVRNTEPAPRPSAMRPLRPVQPMLPMLPMTWGRVEPPLAPVERPRRVFEH